MSMTIIAKTRSKLVYADTSGEGQVCGHSGLAQQSQGEAAVPHRQSPQ